MAMEMTHFPSLTNALGRVESKLDQLEDKVEHSKFSRGTPSESLLGLPLKRLIPQDIHTVADHAVALTNVVAAQCAETATAKVLALSLAGSAMGVSLLTDYRLSAAKLIPIEVHEVFDYVTGAGNIIAPFALGYYKKSPVTAALQIIGGVSVIVASLFTDYRAAKRVRWWRRTKTT
jgi:hypothetical protein